MQSKIRHVPTNIITGFLGTGKTSTIQHLLSFKPENERWAVLVNEFGTVGIDASLYQNRHTESGGIYVREVPGGCMCCVSGLPMQIALNVLLKLSNPHRLLIEPSGLGHPVEVVSMLMSEHYQEVLDIQKIITLVDPQHFIQEKYFSHETYQQQLYIADTWVINKTDKASVQQMEAFEQKLFQVSPKPENQFHTRFGQINLDSLNGKTGFQANDKVNVHGRKDVVDEIPDQPNIPPDKGFLKSSRFDEGYHGTSWRYLKNIKFSRSLLLDWIKSIEAERIKGVFNTNVGVIGLNVLQGQMQIIDFADCAESKLEIISKDINPSWDVELAACVIKNETRTVVQACS